MTSIKKAHKITVKKNPKQNKDGKNRKISKISTIKANANKTNSRKESVKELNRLYSQLLAEHKDNSQKLVSELLKLIGDQYNLHIRQKHSTRILQACLKYGTDEHRNYIFQKIRGKYHKLASYHTIYPFIQHIVTYYLFTNKHKMLSSNLGEIPYLCMTNHGSHLSIKAYRYCNFEAKRHFEDSIIFSTSSTSYVKNRYGSLIWDFMYNKFTTSKQMNSLLQLLVPNSVKLLNHDLYDSLLCSKSLNQFHSTISVETDLFPKYKETCLNLFGKLIDKYLTSTSISHDIGYLACLLANPDELDDLAQRFTQGLDSLYSTKSGVFVACYLYGFTPPKQRKIIVKQLKQSLEEICTNAVTNLFISRVLLTTDDTKLTIEHLIKPLSTIATMLSFDKYGHKILASIASTEALTLFTTYEREVIQLPSPRSLKEFNLRHQQLSEALYPLLLNSISKIQLENWLTNKYSSLVLESMLKRFNMHLFKSIVGTIEQKFDQTLGLLNNNTCLHLIQRLVKRLPTESKETACGEIWNALEPRKECLLKSRAVFLLVSILETLDRSSPVFTAILNLVSRNDITSAKSNELSNCGLEILDKILYTNAD